MLGRERLAEDSGLFFVLTWEAPCALLTWEEGLKELASLNFLKGNLPYATDSYYNLRWQPFLGSLETSTSFLFRENY